MQALSQARLPRAISLVLLVVAILCASCGKTDPGKPDPIQAEPPAAAAERDKFQGDWKHLSINLNGKNAAANVAEEYVYRFEGNRFTNTRSGRVFSRGTFMLDPTKSPPAIDLAETGGITIKGIYRFDGDRLTMCLHERQRPSDFQSQVGQVRSLAVLERMKR